MEYFLLIVGITILIIGGEGLVRSAVGLNMKFKLSPLLIGTTVVSFGTSAPELIVSVKAVLDGNSQIAVGNVIGSNMANIGLVLGITVLLRSMVTDKRKYIWSWSLMFLASIMFFILSLDNVISPFEGMILLMGLFGFVWSSVRYSKKIFNENDVIEGVNDIKYTTKEILFYFIIGVLGLSIGSSLLIDNAVIIAHDLGVSDFVIAISVIALGTSLPELTTSVIAISKGHKSISIGNLLGSNIFNIFAVLGVTSIIRPLAIDPFLLSIDLPIMIGFVVMVGLFMFFGKKMGVIEGIALILAYLAYIVFGFI